MRDSSDSDPVPKRKPHRGKPRRGSLGGAFL